MSDQNISEHELIKKKIIQERIRCKKDPIYFFKKYVKVQHPVRGSVYFHLYPFQEDVLKQFHHHKYNIVLKARQMGLSTLSAAYVLWNMLNKENTKCLVIATKQDTAANFVTNLKHMYDNLPKWLKIDALNNNALSLKLKNGSFIKASSASSDAGRSESLTFLIIDEAAFITDIDRIWASAQQTIATGGKALIISTPNGQGNWYHKNWMKAETNEILDGDIRLNPIRLDWWLHPERDNSWLERQKKLINDDRIVAQEILCSFNASGHTVFPSERIEYLRDTYEQEPIQYQGIDNNVWVWQHPNRNRDYILVADVARGDGNDYSAFHIFDLETMEQVAEYRGLIDTTEYGVLLCEYARKYNKALLVVENNNIGWSTVQTVIDEGYRNVFYTYKNINYVEEEVQIPLHYDTSDKTKMIPGFTTTSKNRPLMIEKLSDYIRDDSIIIKSKRTFHEMDTFIWANGKPQAQKGYNDDLIMAIAITVWVRDTALRLRRQGIELTKKSLENVGMINTRVMREDTWKMNTGTSGEVLDLRDFL